MKHLSQLMIQKVYRLLWIDEGNVIIYLIDVYDEKAMPFRYN